MMTFPKTINGREVLFYALVGSHNYNLNVPESDVDFKAFVIPTFDDLYKQVLTSEKAVISGEEIGVHDIRQLSHLLTKANVNFVEVLFTKQLIIPNLLYSEFVNSIFSRREELARMNLPYLWDSSIGMFHSKYKKMYTGNKNTKHLVEKHGYDTKAFMSAYRILDFLGRFANNEFTDFRYAIRYNGTEELAFMMGLRNGNFPAEVVGSMLLDKLTRTINKYDGVYKDGSNKQDNGIKLWLENNIKEFLQNKIAGGISL